MIKLIKQLTIRVGNRNQWWSRGKVDITLTNSK